MTSKKSNATLLAKYCRDEIAKTCDHELLGNQTHRPRPCSLNESFLSTKNAITLQLRLKEATALRYNLATFLYQTVRYRLKFEKVKGYSY
mgnify:CR=1 FL=1